MSSSSSTTILLQDATSALTQFNSKSDVAMQSLQPIMVEYLEVLKALRQEVVSVNIRAAKCVERSKHIAEKEKIDLKTLKLGQHQELLEEEEKAELK